MPIQTVEEAAKENTSLYNIVGENGKATIERSLNEAFRAGAAWQKEQGIEWISVYDDLPTAKGIGNKGMIVRIANPPDYRIVGAIYSPVNNRFSGDFNGYIVTHWAYINLPK
jgi:hypothetical protein